MHADVYQTTDTNVDNVMKEKEQVLERSNDSEKHVSGREDGTFQQRRSTSMLKVLR